MVGSRAAPRKNIVGKLDWRYPSCDGKPHPGKPPKGTGVEMDGWLPGASTPGNSDYLAHYRLRNPEGASDTWIVTMHREGEPPQRVDGRGLTHPSAYTAATRDHRRPEDDVMPGETASRKKLEVTRSAISPPVTGPIAQIPVDEVPLEALNNEGYEVTRITAAEITRTEAALVERFSQNLAAMAHRVCRYRICPDASSSFIYTDIADITSNILYEAKGSVDRMGIRLALGQVLDYGRYVRRLVPDVELAVLFPEAPPEDMRELLEAHRVGCVVELRSGTFVDLTSLGRCT